MLQFMRNHVAGWAAKILFFLLVAGFAAWELGSSYQSDQSNPQQRVALQVGATAFTVQQVDYKFREQLTQKRQQLKQRNPGAPILTEEQARADGLLEDAIDEMMHQELFKQAAARVGLNVPNDVAAGYIAKLPWAQQYKQDDGSYDQEAIDQVLRAQVSMSLEQYIRQLKEEFAIAAWSRALLGGLAPPDASLDALFASANEKRVLEIVTIRPEMLDEQTPPSDEELQAYYERNKSRFATREKRDLVALMLREDDIKDRVEVDEEDLRAIYKSELDRHRKPVRRVIEQLLFDNEDAAKAAAEALANGATMEAAKGDGLYQQAGEMVKEEFIIPEMADAIFALDIGAPSEPMESDFGWHVFMVTDELEESIAPFEEVRDELQTREYNRLLAELLFDTSQDLEDELNGGSTMEETAEVMGLKLRALGGGTRTGSFNTSEALDGLDSKVLDQIAKIGFSQSPGGALRIHELVDNSGYLVVETVNVHGSVPRPFAEVRDAVLEAYVSTNMAARLNEASEAFKTAAEADDADTLDALAEEKGFLYRVTDPVNRAGTADTTDLSTRLMEAIFDLDEGEIITGASVTAGLVVRVKETQPAGEPQPETMVNIRNLVHRDMSTMAMEAAIEDLRAEIGVSINMLAMEEYYRRQAELLNDTVQ